MADTDLYLSLNASERAELLDAASRKRGIAVSVMEKDYWVCKTLAVLFRLPELSRHLVFKGGTSLSKAYGLIERFSEDVDVSIHREYLGYDRDRDPEAARGKEQRRLLDHLQKDCQACVRYTVLPAFREKMTELLGDSETWKVDLDPGDPQTLLFHYPQAGGPGPSYIVSTVRIEFGARSDHWPARTQAITSYLTETLERPLGTAEVNALTPERTFWEKATLLHAETHRPLEKAMPPRYARHYYDLFRLAQSPVAATALNDHALRRRVVEHKSVFFRSAWARYDLARPPTFRLIPPANRLPALKEDHHRMEPMFFSTPPPLETILETLTDLETRIRTLTR